MNNFTRVLADLCLVMILVLPMAVSSQHVTLVAGDTTNLAAYTKWDPPQRFERVGPGDPLTFPVDLNQDGISDIEIKCGNSSGAMGYASNFLEIIPLGSNTVYYDSVDSTNCFNGYKPVWFAGLFNAGDTISDKLTFTRNSLVVNKQLWFMGDTCTIFIERTGRRFIGVKLNGGSPGGIAWVDLDLLPRNGNGFAADLYAAGFRFILNSVNEFERQEIRVFPNPATGQTAIFFNPHSMAVDATIHDGTGRVIRRLSLPAGRSAIQLGSGFYLLKVMDDTGRNGITRFIVE